MCIFCRSVLTSLASPDTDTDDANTRHHKAVNAVDHRHDALIERQREEKERWAQEK